MPPENEDFNLDAAMDAAADSIDFRTGEQKEDSSHSGEGQDPSAAPAPAPANPWDSHPSSWKKDYHEAYRTLPEHIRKYIHQREGEGLDGIKQYKDQVDAWNRIHAPWQDIYKQSGATPQEVTDTMLNFYAGLARGEPQQRAEVLQQVIQQFGLQDLIPQIYMALNQQQPAGRTTPDPVAEKMTALERQVAQLLKERENEAHAQNTREIEAFAKDSNHPYFVDLIPTIQDMLSRGFQGTLLERYKAALALRDDIQEKIAADKAKAAAEKGDGRPPIPRNVRSSSTPPSPTGKAPAGDIAADMSDVYDSILRRA